MLPVRVDGTGIASGAFGRGCGNVESMTKAMQYAAGTTPEFPLSGTYPIRVVNISKEIVNNNDFTVPPDASLESALGTLALRSIVVLASGNDRQMMNSRGWLQGKSSIVVVGGLNKFGNDY